MLGADDQNLRYKKMVKIGEGSLGTVCLGSGRGASKALSEEWPSRRTDSIWKWRWKCASYTRASKCGSDIGSVLVQDAKIYEVWVVLQFLSMVH